MKEFKGRLINQLFWTACGICAGWFVLNLAHRFTHSLFLSVIAALAIIVAFLYKIYFCDNISIILTDDRQLLVKRFGKIIKAFIIEQYFWSEYSKYSNTKDTDDQDLYYVNKESGQESYIDCTNLSGDDYEQLLTELGAKNQNTEPIKVETVKK